MPSVPFITGAADPRWGSVEIAVYDVATAKVATTVLLRTSSKASTMRPHSWSGPTGVTSPCTRNMPPSENVLPHFGAAQRARLGSHERRDAGLRRQLCRQQPHLDDGQDVDVRRPMALRKGRLQPVTQSSPWPTSRMTTEDSFKKITITAAPVWSRLTSTVMASQLWPWF